MVGKVAPEIKPGKYTYADRDKHPGLQKLMIPAHWARFKPGGPPLAGNFSEIEVVPTRQYYWALAIAKATQANEGKTRLDAKGYMEPASWVSGLPFPKPSGPFKAQQIVYNWKRRALAGGTSWLVANIRQWTGGLREDAHSVTEQWDLQLAGRAFIEPFGWYDQRAKDQGEYAGTILYFHAPRDSFGNALYLLRYLDKSKFDAFYFYLNFFRRTRKLSTTDTQDAVGGSDAIYEDKDGFEQKLSPTRYPYKFELIGEREYLFPYSTDGAETITKKGVELRGLKFQRRPVNVIQLTQMDKNYVCSKRIMYIDKETFLLLHAANYDQKGRLYRTWDTVFAFHPDMGIFGKWIYVEHDYIDTHSTIIQKYAIPATWVGREQVDLGVLYRRGK